MSKKIAILIGAIGAFPCLVLTADTAASTKPVEQVVAKPSDAPTAPAMAPAAAPKKVFTEAEEAKFMEIIGYNIGQGFPLDGMALSKKALDAFGKGILDAVNKKACAYDVEKTMAEAQAFMMEKMKLVEEKSKEKMKIEAEKAKVEATESHVKNEAFIAKLKTDNKNVKETPEGLVYEVISEGKGPKPTDKDLVTVNYRGTLIDGTEFDSSYKTKTPATFVSGEVIEGFRKGIQLVSKGGKVKLFLRPTLAYGDQFRIPGVPNAKAGALLIFEIELVDFKAPPAAATPIVVPPTAAAAPVVSEAAAAARTPPAPESKAPQGVPPANK